MLSLLLLVADVVVVAAAVEPASELVAVETLQEEAEHLVVEEEHLEPFSPGMKH